MSLLLLLRPSAPPGVVERWSTSDRYTTATTNVLITTPSDQDADFNYIVQPTDTAVLLLQMVGSTAPTIDWGGQPHTEVQPLTVVGGMVWGVYTMTGYGGAQDIPLTLSSPMVVSFIMHGYATGGVGNTSTYARPGAQATTVLPGFTGQNAGSFVVDVWAERNAAAGATTLTPSVGTVRQILATSGANTGHPAISLHTPGATTVPTVTGTYNQTSTDGAGLQLEMVPVGVTPAPTVQQYPAAGTVPTVTGTSGTAGIRAATVGTVTATTSTTGAATERLTTTGTVAGTTSTTGATTARLRATGTPVATSTVTGAVSLRAVVAGTTGATSATAGTATAIQGAAGTATASTTVTGDADLIIGPRQYDTTGTITVTSDTTGAANILGFVTPAAAFTDDFNRADGPLGADWATTATALTIAGGRVVGTTAVSAAHWVTPVTSGLQVSQAIHIAGGQQDGVAVAMPGFANAASASGSTMTWYAFRSLGLAAGHGITLKNPSANTYTTLVSSTRNLVGGDVLRLEWDGTTLTGYINGTQTLTHTPASPLTGQCVGIVHVAAGQNGVPILDDWSGGNTAVTPTPPQQYDTTGTVTTVTDTTGTAGLNATVAGTVPATTSTTGATTAQLTTVGTTTGTTTVTGTTTARLAITGTTTSTTGTTGATAARLPATGAATATTSTTGTTAARLTTTGTTPATSTVNGAATVTPAPQQYPAAGTAQAVSGTTGVATVIGGPQQYPTTGTTPATTGTTGTAGLRAATTGTITAATTTTGAASTQARTAGSVTAATSTTGTARLALPATGTIPAATGTHGATLQYLTTTGTVDALVTVTGATELLPAVVPPGPSGRITGVRWRILTASGDVRVLETTGHLRTVGATGELRVPDADGDLTILEATGAIR